MTSLRELLPEDVYDCGGRPLVEGMLMHALGDRWKRYGPQGLGNIIVVGGEGRGVMDGWHDAARLATNPGVYDVLETDFGSHEVVTHSACPDSELWVVDAPSIDTRRDALVAVRDVTFTPFVRIANFSTKAG